MLGSQPLRTLLVGRMTRACENITLHQASFADGKKHFDMNIVLWDSLMVDKGGHIKNFLCLRMKQYIYRQCRENIMQVKSMEKYTAIKNDKIVKYNRKWCIN